MEYLYLLILILGGILLLGLLRSLGLFLLTQRWFWFVACGLSALASAFACIASIIHFQILAALGYFVLAFVLFAMTSAVADG